MTIIGVIMLVINFAPITSLFIPAQIGYAKLLSKSTYKCGRRQRNTCYSLTLEYAKQTKTDASLLLFNSLTENACYRTEYYKNPFTQKIRLYEAMQVSSSYCGVINAPDMKPNLVYSAKWSDLFEFERGLTVFPLIFLAIIGFIYLDIAIAIKKGKQHARGQLFSKNIQKGGKGSPHYQIIMPALSRKHINISETLYHNLELNQDYEVTYYVGAFGSIYINEVCALVHSAK